MGNTWSTWLVFNFCWTKFYFRLDVLGRLEVSWGLGFFLVFWCILLGFFVCFVGFFGFCGFFGVFLKFFGWLVLVGFWFGFILFVFCFGVWGFFCCCFLGIFCCCCFVFGEFCGAFFFLLRPEGQPTYFKFGFFINVCRLRCSSHCWLSLMPFHFPIPAMKIKFLPQQLCGEKAALLAGSWSRGLCSMCVPAALSWAPTHSNDHCMCHTLSSAEGENSKESSALLKLSALLFCGHTNLVSGSDVFPLSCPFHTTLTCCRNWALQGSDKGKSSFVSLG